MSEFQEYDDVQLAELRNNLVKTMQEHPEGLAEGFDSLGTFCHGLAYTAGWWTNLETGEFEQRNVGELVALMHSELSEAYEAYRKDNRPDDHLPQYDGFAVELADLIIRAFDAAKGMGIPIGEIVLAKLAYNAERADHKIENRKKAGGKKV